MWTITAEMPNTNPADPMQRIQVPGTFESFDMAKRALDEITGLHNGFLYEMTPNEIYFVPVSSVSRFVLKNQ